MPRVRTQIQHLWLPLLCCTIAINMLLMSQTTKHGLVSSASHSQKILRCCDAKRLNQRPHSSSEEQSLWLAAALQLHTRNSHGRLLITLAMANIW